MSTALIIGASRGIGIETVKLALKAGHSVRAMARSASAIRLRDPKLQKLDGDALDQHTISVRWRVQTRSFRRLACRRPRR